MNKTYGLLMSGEMICAYSELLKTETRRTRGLDTINRDPDKWKFLGFSATNYVIFERVISRRFGEMPGTEQVTIRPPYGWVGEDTLWFKETWKMYEREGDGKDFLHYRADDQKVDPTWWTKEDWTRPDPIWHKKNVFEKWQSSMLMPKLCSRFKDIPILDVSIQRLQDITFEGAYGEGCPLGRALDPIAWYRDLWDRLNGETMPWIKNPFVWVYKFPKCEGIRI